MRIYIVSNKDGSGARLVEAENPSQAIRHVAASLYEVRAASAPIVARMMQSGAPLETVGKAREAAITEPHILSSNESHNAPAAH